MVYTKGNWKVEKFIMKHFDVNDMGIIADGNFQVCGFERDYNYPLAMPIEEVEANAYLIAASPDLYEACKNIFTLLGEAMINNDEFGDDFKQAHEQLFKALNKAMGK